MYSSCFVIPNITNIGFLNFDQKTVNTFKLIGL
jgi:hypothetical protein